MLTNTLLAALGMELLQVPYIYLYLLFFLFLLNHSGRLYLILNYVCIWGAGHVCVSAVAHRGQRGHQSH